MTAFVPQYNAKSNMTLQPRSMGIFLLALPGARAGFAVERSFDLRTVMRERKIIVGVSGVPMRVVTGRARFLPASGSGRIAAIARAAPGAKGLPLSRSTSAMCRRWKSTRTPPGGFVPYSAAVPGGLGPKTHCKKGALHRITRYRARSQAAKESTSRYRGAARCSGAVIAESERS